MSRDAGEQWTEGPQCKTHEGPPGEAGHFICMGCPDEEAATQPYDLVFYDGLKMRVDYCGDCAELVAVGYNPDIISIKEISQ